MPNFAALTDGFAICPPSEFTNPPVTNIVYSQSVVAGGSSTNISTLKAVNATANATALYHLDLTDFLCRTSAGKGVTVTGIAFFYTFVAAVLTAAPTLVIVGQTFPAAAAAAAAPTALTTLGGTITTTPASPAVAIPTAGQFYTTLFNLGAPVLLNSALQRVLAEFGVPMTAGGTFHLAGAQVLCSASPY